MKKTYTYLPYYKCSSKSEFKALMSVTFLFILAVFPAQVLAKVDAAAVIQDNSGSFSTISWSTAASQPYSVSEAQGEVVNGKLYTFGGFDSQKACCTPTSRAYVYDPAANNWSAIASMPPMNGTSYGGVTHAGFTNDGKDIYFAGGYTSNSTGTGQIFGTKEVWKYIVGENRYVRLPDLPIAISAGQLEYLNGKLYHIAGSNTSRTIDLGNLYVLDLNNLASGWQTLASLPNPRQHAGSAVYEGKIYYIGGQTGHDDHLTAQKEVHRYDPVTNSWSKMADLPVPSGATGRGHISSSVVIVGTRILVLGGETVHKTGRTNMVSAYSPATNTWENLTPLPQSRFSGVAGVMGGNIYYTGGSNTSTTYKGTPEGVTNIQQTVNSFTLINADTDQDIQTLTNGATLNLAALPTKNLNIRANTSPETVGSVVMELTGAHTRTVTENIAPYTLFGDNNNWDYYSWTPAVGSYTLKATPYYASNGTGTVGSALNISFTVSDESTTPPPTTTAAKLINSGGSQFIDGQARTWSADAGFSGGVASSKSFDVVGTTDDALYLSYRHADLGAPFSYSVPLSAGTYTVRLHFLEPWYGAPGGRTGAAGRRVFHVDVEGQRVLSDYDIFAESGAATAAVKTLEGVSVADGTLNIDFTSLRDNAIISAIEILGGTATNLNTLLFTPNSSTVNLPVGQQKELKVNLNNSDEDPVTVQLIATEGTTSSAPAWLLYNGKTLSSTNNATFALGTSGNEVLFTVDASSLAPGTYTATVTASAAGYTSAELLVTLQVATYEESLRPYVTAVRPADGSISVPLSQSVSVDVAYPSGKSLDGNTVTTSTVKLYKVSGTTKTEVTGTAVNATAAGDAITLSATLAVNTTYEFSVSDQVKDLNGYMMKPFTSRFTTITSTSDTPTDLTGVSFTEQILVDNTFGTDGFTSLVIGPDSKLYATTSGGKIERWDIKVDGTLSNHMTISPFGSTRRLLIGLRFDPSATASNLIAWISHSSPAFADAPEWSGKISRVNLTNPSSPQVTDYVINLPRSTKDHATNSIDFGPDGALYFVQGGNTAMGAPDGAWGYRTEKLLSAAVLRLDIAKAAQQSLPINAKTEEGGSYNPKSTSAPLTIYATGIRNAYDLVWHSNGQLYVPTNGSAAGGNTPGLKSGSVWSNGQTYTGPDVPAMTDVRDTQSDYLFRVVKGGYYGHPNVLRNEYIMNGGNPTSGTDPGEVIWTAGGKTYGYPVGTPKEPNHKGWAYDFGLNKSPNGVIEYRSSAFGGKLSGKLLVCRFSGGDDIMVLEPGTSNLDIIRATEGSAVPGLRRPFANPLDVIEDVRNGNLYISEYFDGNGDGQPRITLLKATDPGTLPPTATAAKLINAGGPQYTDSQSRTWAADAGFSGGVTTSKSFEVAGTTDDALYLTYRYAASGAPFGYSVSLPSGTYTVKLHFMEPYFGAPGGGTGAAGRRVFHVDVEGQRVLSNYDIFAESGAATAAVKTFEGVSVADGTLNIDFTSLKDNAIVSAIEILEGTVTNPGDDTTPPVVAVVLTGSVQSPGVYANEVTVSVDASDNGGSGIASVQYSLNGGAYINYTSPVRLTQLGDYTVRAKAVDNNNNETITGVTNFKIVKATQNDTYMVLQNTDGFPADDRLTFSLIQTPWRRTDPVTPYNENHSKVTLKISNKGKNTLTVNSLSLSNSASWKIAQLNGNSYSSSSLPLSISPGASAEAVVEFIAKDQATRVKVLNDTLYISSNDDKTPYKKVVLHGLWQSKGEGNNEPYAKEIISAFGLKSNVGFSSNDGTNDGNSIVSNSDEVAVSFFVRADLSRPVTVVQLAAYHGCCSATETIRRYDKASQTETTIFTHDPLYGQSLLPLKNGTTEVAKGSFSPGTSSSNPNGAFGLRVHKQYTDRTRNSEGKIGLRIWKAIDNNGNVIPNAYIVGHDYIGSDFTNYDYQDNVYFISNVKPESGSANYPILSATPSAASLGSVVIGASKTTTVKLSNAGTSSDPLVQIKSAAIVGPNADEFSVTGVVGTTLATQNYINATVKFMPKSQGIKNAALLVYYNSSDSPLRIPLYGIADNSTSVITAVKRIKGGSDNSVNIAGNTWESDASYRQGSIKLDKQIVAGPISCTDDDLLYQTYLSAASDLAETRYSIPIPNGQYMVRMHFVENYFPMNGARVFHTTIEDQLRLPNFDIHNEVGYRSALVKDFVVGVTDGNMNIKFNPTVNRVAIAGLEIFKASSSVSTTSQSSLSSIESQKIATTERTLKVFPNPINSGSKFYIEVNNLEKNEDLVITMHDITGRLIASLAAKTDDLGFCSKEIILDKSLTRGVYLIRVVAPSGVMDTKLIVN
ncbi:malectin domain-containing carbohydrate-binding protein [Pontibacter locisalis]|uniref:Malectin domain-containing carbohydrate-binding protein n=1 Tax=Pontibacter locisalis TaxID=1719035 RepID=A0ABW5IP53_9BACT